MERDEQSDGSDDQDDVETATGTFDQFLKAPDKEDLPRPETEPAVALTTGGWYEWLEGASEWTPLPNWSASRIGSPDEHVLEGYVRRFNDTLWLPPRADLGTAIDSFEGGHIILENGVYTLDSRIRIPSNITVVGQGVSSVVEPTANTDMFLIGGRMPWKGGNTTALRNLTIDTTAIRDYTSTAVTFSDAESYHGGVEYLQNIVFDMSNGGERGTGIALVDAGGRGIGAVTIANIALFFPDVAIALEVNDGGFVNGNSARNVWAKEPRIGIREVVNEGVIRSNKWEFKMNGEESIEQAIASRGDENHYDLFLDDLGRIDTPAITVEGDGNRLRNCEGSPSLWKWVVDTGVGNEYVDQSDDVWFFPCSRLPYWLDTVGTGEITSRPRGARFHCSGPVGDELAITSPGGLFDLRQAPWLECTFYLSDTAVTGLTRLGFAEVPSDDGGLFLIADPDDVLNTGITTRFLTQFGSGEEASYERTNVPLDNDNHTMALRVIAGDVRGQYDVLWTLDGTAVRTERGLDNFLVSPWFSVQRTGQVRPTVGLSDTVEFRFDTTR